MDLSTKYLGLHLRTPLVPSASPLSQDLDGIRRMNDAGASAIVLQSLFEEQLTEDRTELHHYLTMATNSFSEAQNFLPGVTQFRLGPEEYLEHIRRAAEAVDVPVIASLNGSSLGRWIEFAAKIEQAGADALELNIYDVPCDSQISGSAVEEKYLDIVKSVRASVRIPLAVKLSPFFSNLPYMARRLEEAGANSLVLFNRFYQPDIDLENLEVQTRVLLSAPQALRLPLRWIAILSSQLDIDLAATSGIHGAHDVLKLLMVGADVTMLCSVLFARGISHLKTIEKDLQVWMEEHGYQSVKQMQGSMSQAKCADPSAFERAHYVRAISRLPHK
jgi:dihydroorotate dehydrogenase (fumarate)